MISIFSNYRARRILGVFLSSIIVAIWIIINPASYETEIVQPDPTLKTEDSQSELETEDGATQSDSEIKTEVAPLGVSADSTRSADSPPLATTILERLDVKGRAPKTGYARTEFYNDWPDIDGCSLRQRIIKREFGDSAVLNGCNVVSGSYIEPYTGETKIFNERSEISTGVQIDHVVALSDAWQKGAQNITKDERYNLATDPLNLLAVDASANQKKSDGDAATWLPSNKPFRCQYVARQVSVKYKYHLWITEAEKSAIGKILELCPNEPAVGIQFGDN